MSHYDCRDCGEHLGIAYGSCQACTPSEVLRLGVELKKAQQDARNKWIDDHFAERQQYVAEQTKELQAAYDKAFEEGKKKK